MSTLNVASTHLPPTALRLFCPLLILSRYIFPSSLFFDNSATMLWDMLEPVLPMIFTAFLAYQNSL